MWLWHRCISVNFGKISRTPRFTEELEKYILRKFIHLIADAIFKKVGCIIADVTLY